MALDPANSAIDRIRLNTGDSEEPFILEDAVIQYMLDTNSDNEYKTTIQALEAIVAKFAKYTHEEIGDEEVWGQEAYESYRKLLRDWKNDPSLVGDWKPFAGGISKKDIRDNKNDPDTNQSGIVEGSRFDFCSSIWDR